MDEYIASIGLLILGIIWLVLQAYVQPTIGKVFYLGESQNKTFAYLLKFSIIFLCLAGITLNLPVLLDLHKSIVASILLSIWLVQSLRYMFKLLPSPSIRKVIYIGLFSLIGLYGILISWNQAPSLSEIPEWLNSLSQYTLNMLAIPIGLLGAIFMYSIGCDLLFKLVLRTQNTLDDQLAKLCQLPFSATIFFIGLNYTISHSMPSEFWRNGLRSLIFTTLLLIWSWSAYQSIAIFLNYMVNKEGSWRFVKPRTKPVYQMLGRLFVFVTTIYLLLMAWGINLMLWLTSAGIVGIALAYASQDTLASLLSGVAILTDAPYKIGDFLVLEDGQRGRITEIGFRSTRMMTPDDVEIIIPNSVMANTKIINMTGGPHHYARIDCNAGVAYGSDIEQVKQILYDIANELNYIVKDKPEMAPQVHFISMGASSLDFVLRIWIIDPQHMLDIQDQANSLIYERFQSHSIEIPYSKQDIYLYPMQQKDSNNTE
jgi:MscS family membrane protein